MSRHLDHISSGSVAFDFNRSGGNIENFAVTTADGTVTRPLHTAPWASEAATLPDDIALVERQLSGDFFCAPFGVNPGGPIHGATANGTWQPTDRVESVDGAVRHTYLLEDRVHGAVVTKTLTVRPGHPVLYQCHRFEGGSGHLPVAHHAMIRVPGGAQLSFSKKQFGITPNAPPESDPQRGFSMLAYPQKFEGLDAVRTAADQSVDASFYPFSKRHEDIVVMAEATGSEIGWSAALADQDGFLFFAVKDARALPETLLWMSNGGRNYAPWSGRHTCVLGIEEAATACHASGAFASSDTRSPSGLVQALALKASTVREIRYGFGAIPAPPHWREVADIRVSASELTLVDVSGAEITLPFDGTHFGL
uniref:hypothetical protein n=1 Tax=Pararhizobium sp. IMCC3301 TaxID=3067904 RepID=UPI002741283E|nr:hypothetical protein [Pararhizobium sp. IMCC3301]